MFELILALEDEGWQGKLLPRGTSKRHRLQYVPGDPKLWYTTGVKCCGSYVLCLLRAPDLIGAGLPSIPHYLEDARDFTEILRGEPLCQREAVAALEDDVQMPALANVAHGPGGPARLNPGHPEGNDDGIPDVEDVDFWFEFEHDLELIMDAQQQLVEAPEAGVGSEAGHQHVEGHAARRLIDDVRHFYWGSFKFTAVKGQAAWQVHCDFHRLSDVSYCRRRLGMANNSVEEESAVIRTLKAWCLEAENHDRQRSHLEEPLVRGALLDDETLDALLATGNLETGPCRPCRTDVELDAVDAAPAAARGRGGRGRRGGGRARSGCRGGRRGRGRAAGPTEGTDSSEMGSASPSD